MWTLGRERGIRVEPLSQKQIAERDLRVLRARLKWLRSEISVREAEASHALQEIQKIRRNNPGL
jgi:hypothetical protein